jgi:glycosyltransferase involved in cell wall biosynthesis
MQPNSKPISVVATVLNESQDIARLVSSLLQQTPPAEEVIVVDGGSTDGTWEWLVEAAQKNSTLRPIRDESCNLKRCAGPISRGRNVAIDAARSELIACVDAGCTYPQEWLARITAPLTDGSAQYALGGSCLDLADPTVWDLASAHFFGVRLEPTAPTKSCTARAMAFTKDLWERIGGFPETAFFGEDTLFDQQARQLTQPAFLDDAKALYRPQYTLLSACHQLARYSISDGVLGVRPARLFRNAARCMVEVAALLCLNWSVVPLLVVLVLEGWFAFHPDWRSIARVGGTRALLARYLFSVFVPWIVAWNQIRGSMTRKFPPNRQNL